MTEQDYEKSIEDAANGYAEMSWGELVDIDTEEEELAFKLQAVDFKAGVAFARANPAPEVLEMVEALEYALGQLEHAGYTKNATIAVYRALTRFKERGRG